MKLIRENRINYKVPICSVGGMYQVHARKSGWKSLSLKVGTTIAPKLKVDELCPLEFTGFVSWRERRHMECSCQGPMTRLENSCLPNCPACRQTGQGERYCVCNRKEGISFGAANCFQWEYHKKSLGDCARAW